MMSSSVLPVSQPFDSKPNFGKPPPLGMSRHGSSKSSSLVVKREWNGVVPAAIWNVKGENLEMVPSEFPLERTHREVFDDASKVAARISNVLRELSIETEFDCEKAKAKCTTNDYVCFRIRLYAGDESGQPVIVEVQRRNGSSFSFMRRCREILDGAEGVRRMQRMVPPFLKSPVSKMACLQSVAKPVTEVSSNSLDGVMSMIRSSSRDNNLLGLENLVSLTNIAKTDAAEAIRASKSIVLSDDVREEIRSFTERDVFVADDDEVLRHTDHLRQLSLSVLANSIDLCGLDGCLDRTIKSQKWFSGCLIPTLLDELKRAEAFANNAHQAARCVRSIVSCSEVGKNSVIDQGGIPILEQAHYFGLLRHQLLASESKQCLDFIGHSPAS
jgi:hypothetical protein